LLLLPREAACVGGGGVVNVPSAVLSTGGLGRDAIAGSRTPVSNSEMRDVK